MAAEVRQAALTEVRLVSSQSCGVWLLSHKHLDKLWWHDVCHVSRTDSREHKVQSPFRYTLPLNQGRKEKDPLKWGKH